MLKKTSKILILTILMGLLISSSVVYAEDWRVSGWSESDPIGIWKFNEFPYFTDSILVKDNAARHDIFPEDTYNKLIEYIRRGYEIKYYVRLDKKEIDDGIFQFKFNGTDIGWAEQGVNGVQKNWITFYYTPIDLYTGFDTSQDKYYFTAKTGSYGRFSGREWLKIWLRTRGDGGDDMNVMNCYFVYALLDKAQPNIISVKYYNDENLTNEITDNTKLSYNGSQNSIYMAVEFDEDITVNDISRSNFIRTSMTLQKEGTNEDTEVGSFKYYKKVNNNKVVFEYKVNYGDKGQLLLRNEDKAKFLKEIESFNIKDKYDNEFKSTFMIDSQAYNSGKTYNITIDGNPPQISVTTVEPKGLEVEYNIIGGNEQYLNSGDIFEIKLKFDSDVNVSSNGFIKLNNTNKLSHIKAKAKFYLDEDKINRDNITNKNNSVYNYKRGEWIYYRYVVNNGDDTNMLAYENVANPVENLGVKDYYGNIGQMPTSGEGETKNFPALAYNKNNQALNIFVDTISPRIDFGNNKYTTYRNQHVINLNPIETGSMLVNGNFEYVINKSSMHPTNGSLNSCLGKKSYGFSSGGGTINITINDDLYIGTDGYTQYDQKYDELNMTGKYENVNYVDGTASDVLHEGRREITGKFYVHTYIEDNAGNKTWATSQPIYMDNTHPQIKLTPNGTINKYVGDIDVNFELLGEEPSGFKKYEYRWISPVDLGGKKLNRNDMYKTETDTYKLLRDNNNSWITRNTYSMSKIPIPSRQQRQHGASYLLIRTFDNADNISYIVSEPYYFDKEPPVVKFKSESGGFDKPLKNHKIMVTIDDKDSRLAEYKYYFSNSNLTREIDDDIWEYLDLQLPDLPDNYDPFEEYKKPNKDKEDEEKEYNIKQAILETNKWKKESLNGHVTLHIYAKDSSGNIVIDRTHVKIDNGGFPMISFDYDNAIGNRYKSVIGHINCSDEAGIKTLEYKWSQTKDEPQQYDSIDIASLDKSNLKVDTAPFNTSGEWYLHVRATDIFDNVTKSVSEKYIINSTAPNIKLFQIDNSRVYGSKERNIAITINKSVDDKLEYTYVVYSNSTCDNEIKRGTFSTTSEIVNIQLNDSSDLQEYYFKFYDSLNQVTESSIKVQARYDNTPPTADLIYSPDSGQGVTANNVTVTLNNISDNVSVKDNITVSEDKYTFTENGEHIFTLTDEIGNERTYVARVTWIKDDKPIVRVNTNNVTGQRYKSLSFDLIAQRPTQNGYIDIVDPQIYYQFSTLNNVEDKDYIKYKKGETISLSENDGEYYLHTKLVDGGRSFTNMYGKYILDKTINEPKLTYSYEDSEGTELDCTQEEYNALSDINSIVEVTLEFDEDIVIKSVINNDGKNLPCENQVTYYNNDTITVTYMDKAGNEGSKEIAISNINRVDDSIITITPNKSTNGEVAVVITAPSNKRINNIKVDDEPIDMDAVTTTKQDNSEDNYLTAKFTLLDNCNIKVDIFNKDDKDAVVDTEEYNVTNIDKIAPVGNIVVKDIDKYTKTTAIKITDENPTKVTKVEFIKEDNSKVVFDTTSNYTSQNIIYNHITNSVTTKINGIVKYYFEDSASNKGEAQESINTINTNLDINKVSATYKVGDKTYNDIASIGKVNKDVEVTVNIPEGYYIVNNSGKNKRLFVVGMEYDFLISNGINIGKFSVDLTNTIKKSGPKLKLEYTIGGKIYTEALVNGKTNQNVLITVTSDDNISKVVFDSVEDSEAPYSYEFSENKIINIVATDTIGNTTTLKASIDCIDKEPVRAGLFSLYTKPTKDNIKLQFLATKPVDIIEVRKNGNIDPHQNVSNNVDKYEFIVNDNGTYSVKYRDDIGNEKVVSLEVNNIDRTAPNIKLLYNGKETKPVTNDTVMVSVELVNKSQEPHGIKVLNTIGNSNSYLFKENGKFTFRVSDMAGNVTEKEVIITSIDREPIAYKLTYSETNLTKNDIVATIAIDKNEKNYRILNSDIDQDNMVNSVNKKVNITGNIISITFDDNGYYQLFLSDEAGNKSTILLRVKNIDRIKPTLKFKNDYVVTRKGVMPKLNDVIAYDTHDGDIKEKVNIEVLDVSTEGDKTIAYTVSDTAGNTVTLNRVIKVISEDDYTVVIDGKINPKSFYSNGEETDIKVFNFVENATIKYIEGKVKDGEFKQNGQVYSILLDTIDDNKLGSEEIKLSFDKSGWYTIYIMDLNRQTASFSVWITE
ncbi:MAG: DUF5011 domain-containing protein [Vallitalea sp.]|nr:DUF5011 domain-containing protein [Vallitalea sp.]